jgi:hypothetical protein
MTITYLKELIVVLVISSVIFWLAKPIAMTFSYEADFNRRRNIWFALTIAAFLSPSFWLYAVLAVPLLVWAGRKDSNPVALYLLLMHVIPDIPVSIPTVFELSNYRLLSLCVLVPAAYRLSKSTNRKRVPGMRAVDLALLGWVLLQVAIFIPPDLPSHVLLHDSFTALLRRAFLLFIDVYVLYYVVSRCCSTRRAILEAQAAFCVSCAVLSLISVFEFLRSWLLYVDVAARWAETPDAGFYLLRGDALRAQASAGHPLALGYLIAIAFGFWLYLQSHIKSTKVKLSVGLLFWLGLIAAYSRGPWVGAVAIYFAFAALGPAALSRLFKSLCAAAIATAALMASPLGDGVIRVLPFMGGSVDSGSTRYRQRLAARAWELLQAHPFFGDQVAYLKMEDLRQGQGIIDFVNTYADIAVFYGFVGLALFAGFIVIGLLKSYRIARKNTRSDRDMVLLGVDLVACISGTLLMIGSCSLILGYAKMFYVLGGLAVGYMQLGAQRASDSAAEIPTRGELRRA